MSKENDVYILKNDNSYVTSKPTDSAINAYALDNDTVALVFPMNGINGPKYILVQPENIPNNVHLKITGSLEFITMGADTVDASSNNTPIDMEANTIAQFFAVLCSLYNIELCCEKIDDSSGYYSMRPSLMEPSIDLEVNGNKYHLDEKIFYEVYELDEFDPVNDLSEQVLFMSYIIDYLETTACGMDPCAAPTTSRKNGYILYGDGTYEVIKSYINKEDRLKYADKYGAAVLINIDCSLYCAVDIFDYSLYSTLNNTATMSWIIYECEPGCMAADHIPEEDLNITVIEEQDGYAYEVHWENTSIMYDINSMIYLLLSTGDIIDILHAVFFDIYTNGEEDFMHICMEVTMPVNIDKTHCASLIEAVTSKRYLREGVSLYDEATKSFYRLCNDHPIWNPLAIIRDPEKYKRRDKK